MLHMRYPVYTRDPVGRASLASPISRLGAASASHHLICLSAKNYKWCLFERFQIADPSFEYKL